MFTWLRRLFGPEREPPPRLVAVALAVADLEARTDWLEGELKSLRGRVVGAERRRKAAQDDPGETNGDEQGVEVPPKRFAPSANLARRFRGF